MAIPLGRGVTFHLCWASSFPCWGAYFQRSPTAPAAVLQLGREGCEGGRNETRCSSSLAAGWVTLTSSTFSSAWSTYRISTNSSLCLGNRIEPCACHSSNVVCHEDHSSWESASAAAKNIFLIERFCVYIPMCKQQVTWPYCRFILACLEEKSKITKETLRGYRVSSRKLCISCLEGSSIFNCHGVQHCTLQFQTKLNLNSCWVVYVMHCGLFFHMRLQLYGFLCWAWPSEEQA